MKTQALLFINGVLHSARIIDDTESFVRRAYAGMGYCEVEYRAAEFMGELRDGCAPVLENPAQKTRIEFLTV